MLLPKAFSFPEKSSTKDHFGVFTTNQNFALGNGNSHVVKFIESHSHSKFIKPLSELKKAVATLEKIENSNLIFGSFSDNILKIALLGDMFFLLKRNDKINILASPSPTTVAFSGEFKPEDEYILCSKKTYDVLNELNSKDSFNDFISNFSKNLESFEDKSQINVLFLKFQEKPDHQEKISIAEKTDNITEGDQKTKQSPKKSVFLPFLLKTFANLNMKLIKFAAFLIIFFLVGGVILNTVLKITNDAKKKITEESKKIENLKTNFDNAKNLLNLNNVRSKEIATQTLNELKKIDLNSIASKENKQKIQDLITSLEKIIKDAGMSPDTKGTSVYSISLLNKNANISLIAGENDEIAALDEKQKLAYFINLSTKKTQSFNLAKFSSSPKLITKKGDNIFIAGDDGVVLINIVSGKIQTAFKNDTQWKNIQDIKIFNDNVYLLDDNANQIWKYISNDSGFSAIQPYFSSIKPKSPISFSIDMTVYTIENSTIKKYLSGDPQTFALKDPSTGKLTKPRVLATSENLDNLYILEPSTKRILIYNKKGEYQKQIVDNQFANITSFSIDEKNKEIYFPLGANIYKLGF
jgi:hypothetical protein